MKSPDTSHPSDPDVDDPRQQFAKLAHDLRTPLNTVIGFSQLLLLKEEDVDKLHHLKAIHQAGETLLTMINDIMQPAGEAAHAESAKSTEFNVNTVHFSAADIIVADNSENNRELLVTILQSWPFTVREAQHGQQLLDKVHEHTPDLILTGIKMPVLDGYQAATRLKAAPETQSIPIIAVTALAQDQSGEQAGSKVFDDYLIKPFSQSELVEAMMKILPYEQEAGDQPVAAPDTSLTREALQTLPEPLRQKMYRAVVIGDFSQLRTLIDQIDVGQKVVADGLLTLAEQYDQTQLQELFADQQT